MYPTASNISDRRSQRCLSFPPPVAGGVRARVAAAIPQVIERPSARLLCTNLPQEITENMLSVLFQQYVYLSPDHVCHRSQTPLQISGLPHYTGRTITD